jgi:hypothetical protein
LFKDLFRLFHQYFAAAVFIWILANTFFAIQLPLSEQHTEERWSFWTLGLFGTATPLLIYLLGARILAAFISVGSSQKASADFNAWIFETDFYIYAQALLFPFVSSLLLFATSRFWTRYMQGRLARKFLIVVLTACVPVVFWWQAAIS